MLEFKLDKPTNRPLQVLCLGAHSDDLEIGCGGTVIRIINDFSPAVFRWIVFSGNPHRAAEAHRASQALLAGATDATVEFKTYRDGFFPWQGDGIKSEFERLKSDFDPDLILTHYRHDLHQDHRIICDLTWNTFRNHLVLEYEVPKYDGDIGNPNLYFGLDDSTRRKKIDIILQSFASQADKQWFTEETFNALMRLRGIEANAPTGYAEAFYSRKATV